MQYTRRGRSGPTVSRLALGCMSFGDTARGFSDIDTAVVLLPGANGATRSITNSRGCSFGYDQRIEASGSKGMLSAGNQLATSVRRSEANATEVAPPYFTFFLDRYTPAYRAELDHLINADENGTTPSPGFADGRSALVLADEAN